MKYKISNGEEEYWGLEAKKPEEILNESDRVIWSRFKSGDEEAFVVLYKKFVNTLFGYGCRFSKDQELVKDCLQDFFIYLREKRTSIGTPVSVKSYLLKAFRRRVLDYVKKRDKVKEKNQKAALNEFPIESFFDTISSHTKNEEGRLANMERALKSLNSKEREAIYFFYYQNLSYEEIAKLFEYTHISSSRRLVYKALSKMKKYLKFTSRD